MTRTRPAAGAFPEKANAPSTPHDDKINRHRVNSHVALDALFLWHMVAIGVRMLVGLADAAGQAVDQVDADASAFANTTLCSIGTLARLPSTTDADE
ncbi:hypothetical protein [Paraburkholderia sediminicola]|uniref:hypothetical protein n=1 Tax=Paraburkholderia sediminicola TaxID=458836 RepID=UPI0038B9C289